MPRSRLVRRGPARKPVGLIPRLTIDFYSVPKEERLAFLLKVSDTGPWVPKSNLARLRAYFNRNKTKLLPMRGAICYVCDGKAHHRHHVVPLSRGGGNTKKNLVPLCNQCHKLIHPWMKIGA